MTELLDHLQAQQHALAQRLMSLFPPHPHAHNTLVALEGTTKHAPVIPRAATLEAYLTHLSPQAFGGAGALGMYPGFSLQIKDKPRWCVPFLAVDFDGHGKEDLVPLATTLEGYGLHVYLSDGTTGRGCHLYLFPAGYMPQWKGFAVVKAIQAMAREAGLGNPEIRPSCESGRGSPIFLPYRGGGIDGLGFNPLWELDAK